jgi:hypothetical protein
MKELRLTFEDDDFARLERAKEGSKQNWHDFILLMAVRKMPGTLQRQISKLERLVKNAKTKDSE